MRSIKTDRPIRNNRLKGPSQFSLNRNNSEASIRKSEIESMEDQLSFYNSKMEKEKKLNNI